MLSTTAATTAPTTNGTIQSTFMTHRGDLSLLKQVSYPFSFENDARIMNI